MRKDKTMKRWLAYLALGTAVILSGCGNKSDEEPCRSTARTVFPAVIAKSMTMPEGQGRIDVACKGVSASDRKVILDSERNAATARSLP